MRCQAYGRIMGQITHTSSKAQRMHASDSLHWQFAAEPSQPRECSECSKTADCGWQDLASTCSKASLRHQSLGTVVYKTRHLAEESSSEYTAYTDSITPWELYTQSFASKLLLGSLIDLSSDAFWLSRKLNCISLYLPRCKDCHTRCKKER